MSFTALEKMRKLNKERFGIDVGPMQPALFDSGHNSFDLKSAALRFLHERCENLRFDPEIEAEEEQTGTFRGTSRKPNQIPYNMEMDINRLCLERELERFFDSGTTQDAFDVYYCFMEIFFGSYRKSKRIVELLGEFEANSSVLLMKHRDHYSHSVYVFALGLAIYESNANFRRAFNNFYHFDPDGNDPEQSGSAANFFLEFWGLTSLFHDIGYPFELSFEQMIAYFDADDARGKSPYIIYKNMETMTALCPQAQKRFRELYGREFHTINEVLAYDITQKLGAVYDFSENYLLKVLEGKPEAPEKYSYYMDHAYFSALLVFREMNEVMGFGAESGSPARKEVLRTAHVDALSAILLHYVVYRYSIAFSDEGTRPNLTMELHPLAWLLMLCDELQCWDRAAYGRNSRSELQPMSVEFDFSDNRLVARYQYDEEEQDKIDAYLWEYATWKKDGKPGEAPELKAYSDMAGENKSFLHEIDLLVDTSGIPLTVVCDITPVDRSSKQLYLSYSNFIHMYDFALALNARYTHDGHEDEVDQQVMEAEFEALSLEYKLMNINQVKSFSRYLNAIHCFYTDRQVDFDMLTAFTPEEIGIIGPMEYERWVREHQSMGWRFGDAYERVPVCEYVPVPDGDNESARSRMLREQMRCHKLAMDGDLTKEKILAHYEELSDADKGKDWKPFNSMLKLVKRFDGLRIYRFAIKNTF